MNLVITVFDQRDKLVKTETKPTSTLKLRGTLTSSLVGMLDTVDHFKFRDSRIDFGTNEMMDCVMDKNILALALLGPQGESVGSCYILNKG